MRLTPVLGLFLACTSTSVFAASATIDLNEDVVHLDFAAQPNPKALEFNAGLFSHQGDSSANGDRNGELYYAGIMTKDRMTNFRDVEFGLGGQVGYLDDNDLDGGYLGLSVNAKYMLPDAKGLSLAIGGTYAPGVLSGGDLDSLWSLNAEAAWRVVPRGEIVAGYRHIELNIVHWEDVTFEESWYAGFKLHF